MTTANQTTSTTGSESCNTISKKQAVPEHGHTKTVVMNCSRILMKKDGIKWWNVKVSAA